MTSTPEYVPTIVLSKASAGGAHEKPELTALIHGLEASMKSAIEATGARVISVDGFTDADVDVVGAGLTATGRAADGVVEAVESTDPTSPLIAVQWHPEDDKSSEHDRELLFGWLTAQAREFHSRHSEIAV
ncbi:gamma-glutamyl-gamma-aminobutyrate hydrolase family protein [Rhodoglobus sp.]